jgi:hypothetical protein
MILRIVSHYSQVYESFLCHFVQKGKTRKEKAVSGTDREGL